MNLQFNSFILCACTNVHKKKCLYAQVNYGSVESVWYQMHLSCTCIDSRSITIFAIHVLRSEHGLHSSTLARFLYHTIWGKSCLGVPSFIYIVDHLQAITSLCGVLTNCSKHDHSFNCPHSLFKLRQVACPVLGSWLKCYFPITRWIISTKKSESLLWDWYHNLQHDRKRATLQDTCTH